MTREMILRRQNGQEAVMLYDDDDADLLERHLWFLNGGHKGRALYAVTAVKRKTIRAARLLLGFPEGKVSHIDGNGLNITRSNLRIRSHKEILDAARKVHGNWAKPNRTHGISFHRKVDRYGVEQVYAYDRITKRRLSEAEILERTAQ